MRTLTAIPLLLFASCATAVAPDDALDGAKVTIQAATAIPADGACARVVATRLSDFQTSTYVGPLAGAVLTARIGEHRVTAIAYPTPCNPPPASPAWQADEVTATFGAGANALMLNFKRKVRIDVIPGFEDDQAPPLVERAGSRVDAGRNGEDAAGPDLSLDGWEVKRIALPPAAPTETTLFSTIGHLSISPRGMARLDDGRLVFHSGTPLEPLAVFDAGGTFLESLPVRYPTGTILWDFNDGMDGFGQSIVRCGWLNNPIACDPDDDTGAGCIQAGIEILERRVDPDGTAHAEVVQQILLPHSPELPLNLEFPVGVTALGGEYIVATLPGDGDTRLVRLDGAGTVVGETVRAPGDLEGLFDTGDGRLGALDYNGALTLYAADLTPIAGTAQYPNPLGVSLPGAMGWSETLGQLVVHGGAANRIFFVDPAFTSATDSGIDLSDVFALAGLDVKNDSNQLLAMDRLPPIDPGSGTRLPAVRFYSLATPPVLDRVQPLFTAPELQVRPRGVAYVPETQWIVTIYIRPGDPPDPIRAQAYLHTVDGGFVRMIDLAPLGVARIQAVNALSGELLFTVLDSGGVQRLLVTDLDGNPRRSYRTDALPSLTDVAAFTSGPFAGDVAVGLGQPSELLRLAAP